MTTVRFLDAAGAELLAALDDYSTISPILGADFLDEIESVLDRIGTFPRHGSPYLHGTRHVVLRGFPFQLVYVLEGGEAIIAACAHQHREPGYWRRRLSD